MDGPVSFFHLTLYVIIVGSSHLYRTKVRLESPISFSHITYYVTIVESSHPAYTQVGLDGSVSFSHLTYYVSIEGSLHLQNTCTYRLDCIVLPYIFFPPYLPCCSSGTFESRWSHIDWTEWSYVISPPYPLCYYSGIFASSTHIGWIGWSFVFFSYSTYCYYSGILLYYRSGIFCVAWWKAWVSTSHGVKLVPSHFQVRLSVV